METEKTALIRALNDELRQHHRGGLIVATSGVTSKGHGFVRAALCAIAADDKFDADNDPWGEHDFGEVAVSGTRLFWKIDYHDGSLAGGAEDPSDARTCRRVLTIMLPCEY